MSDELIGQTITVVDSLQPGVPSSKKTFELPGEEVLLHLGYSLGNCSRFGGADNNACSYDIYVPATTLVVLVTTAMVLLAYCVRDPH